jgi:uncharacterized membrane protein YjgN (DUF898 family)
MTTTIPAAHGFEASEWGKLGATRPPPAEHAHALEFTGSGSEYFRIWIVNLLLTLGTLGLYHPWAKVRKLRYFYGNTRLAGHAFDFHGEPKRMLRGYLLVGALFALYAFAGQISPVAGLVALAIVAVIWPALLRASLRFRLAQTSWRGLRFHFAGTTADAYKALAPVFGLAIVGALAAWVFMPMPDDAMTPAAPRPAPGFDASFLFALLPLALMLCLLPYVFWRIKRYQHDHYQFASVRTRFTAGPGSFYKLGLKAFGLVMLCGLVGGVAAALVGGGAAAAGAPGFAVVAGALSVVAVYGVMLFVIQPYVVSRLQNLVWPRTESRTVGFSSTLRFGPLARLMAVNWILIVLTLGLYWPFAAVKLARARLQSVEVLARGDLDALVARGTGTMRDASGDAAADLFGIDLGL